MPFERFRRTLFPRKSTDDLIGAATADPPPARDVIDEEALPGYETTAYYPATVGDILHSRYRVLGKLGYGASATVWLCRDQACVLFPLPFSFV